MDEGPAIRGSTASSRLEVLHAFKWSLLGEATSRLIAPLVFLALARLLTPEDFGVVAAATVLISLCQAMADAGLGKALVQRQRAMDDGTQAAFWMALGVSTSLMAALIIAAPSIAAFFGDPRIAPVVRVLALQVPLTGLSAVPIALLQRGLGFRELFWVRLVTAGLPALASVPMAWAGYGYWALVVGAVAGQLLQCITLWMRADWRPKWRLNLRAAGQLAKFGRWSSLSAMLSWSYAWLDSLIVARYLGIHDMGLYRISNTFVTMVFGLLFAPLLPVLYSLLSRSGHDSPHVAASLLITSRAIILVSLPLAALIALLSTQVEVHLFGPAWSGLAPLLALLAIGQGFAWLVGANGEAYRAVGRPDLEVRVMGISILLYVVGYVVAIQYGLLAFVATRAVLVFLGLALHVWVTGRLFGTGPRPWLAALGKPVLMVAVSAFVTLAAATPTIGATSSFAMTAIFVATYLLLVATFDRQHLNELWSRLRGA